MSSTLGELAAERRAVARAISALRLTPVMFEAGARPHPPRELYQAYLAQSDVFIGLYWQQYGQIGPGLQVSGLEDEFDLSARPDVAEIGRRHADYYRALAERADRPLRGLDQAHAAGGLEAEAANLAAAVDWYLARDRAPLPHLSRVLWLFWGLRDHPGEARGWIDQLLPAADSLEPHAQAELLWTAATTALEVVGDDQAMLACSQRLESLLPKIRAPYLHAVSQLAVAGVSAVVGDFDGACGKSRPAWRSSAARTNRTGRPWPSSPSAWWRRPWGVPRTPSATCARRGPWRNGSITPAQCLVPGAAGHPGPRAGRPEEARPLLDEGLELSLATHSTRNVTLCLTAFAQLAFVQGDGDRAALLAGAAEGLRQRVGLRAWPLQQQGEAQFVAQIRQALRATGLTRVSPRASGSTASRRSRPSA